MEFIRNITLSLAVIAVAIAGATPVFAQKAAAPATKKAKAPKSTAKKTTAKKSTTKPTTKKAKAAQKKDDAEKGSSFQGRQAQLPGKEENSLRMRWSCARPMLH